MSAVKLYAVELFETVEEAAQRGTPIRVFEASYQLPCDLRVPPALLLGRGCQLSTLMEALSYREGAGLEFANAWSPALPDQYQVLGWATESFGAIALNRDERAARLAEEAIEVAQTQGVPLSVIQRIARRVYERPPGEIGREIGGVGITVLSLAANLGRDFANDTRTEWQRVQSKTRDWWQQKHAEKVAAGTADLTPIASEGNGNAQ